MRFEDRIPNMLRVFVLYIYIDATPFNYSAIFYVYQAFHAFKVRQTKSRMKVSPTINAESA